MSDWTMPPVKLGDRVIVARSVAALTGPTGEGLDCGLVTRVRGRTINISVIKSANLWPMMACRHYQDPRLLECPTLFEDPHFGVWKLSKGDADARSAIELTKVLQDMLADMTKRVERLEKPVAKKPK